MKKELLLSGELFAYSYCGYTSKHFNYRLCKTDSGDLYISEHNFFVCSVSKVTDNFVYFYTTVLNKRVSGKLPIESIVFNK